MCQKLLNVQLEHRMYLAPSRRVYSLFVFIYSQLTFVAQLSIKAEKCPAAFCRCRAYWFVPVGCVSFAVEDVEVEQERSEVAL